MALWNEYVISIHALLAESDRPGITRYYAGRHFYPRSPCGERLCDPKIAKNGITISIHALLAESDSRHNLCPRKGKNFYPRSPCGERHNTIRIMQIASIISIHALLAESDDVIAVITDAQSDFYPRSPCGERLCGCCARFLCWVYFYPRSPCGERRQSFARPLRAAEFLSTLSLRRATREANHATLH